MFHPCLNIVQLGTWRIYTFLCSISHSSSLETKRWTRGTFGPHWYSNQYVFTLQQYSTGKVLTYGMLKPAINNWESPTKRGEIEEQHASEKIL